MQQQISWDGRTENGRTDRQKDGQMEDEQTDGQTDGWTNGRMDGWKDGGAGVYLLYCVAVLFFK